MDVLLTAIAPAFSLLFGDMQFAPLRQRAAADQLQIVADDGLQILRLELE